MQNWMMPEIHNWAKNSRHPSCVSLPMKRLIPFSLFAHLFSDQSGPTLSALLWTSKPSGKKKPRNKPKWHKHLTSVLWLVYLSRENKRGKNWRSFLFQGIESFSLENTIKNIESNHKANTARSPLNRVLKQHIYMFIIIYRSPNWLSRNNFTTCLIQSNLSLTKDNALHEFPSIDCWVY